MNLVTLWLISNDELTMHEVATTCTVKQWYHLLKTFTPVSGSRT